jgi:hydrogenase-4 component E
VATLPLPPTLLSQLTSLIGFGVLVVAFLLVWRQSFPARITLFAVQSAMLAALAGLVGVSSRKPTLALVALAFLVIKAWAIPRVLRRLAPALPRPAAGGGSPAGPLLAAGVLVVIAYAVLLPVTRETSLPTAGGIPLALATGLIGLLLCVLARHALPQVLGFLVFENGIFMLALLAAYGLPVIVEVGVFLDVLVAVMIATAVVAEIQQAFPTAEVSELRHLRG